MDGPRYAIYFVPPACSDLYRFGARLLGYDCYSGKDLAIRRTLGSTRRRGKSLRMSRGGMDFTPR
jgi:hypothetical protein